MLLAVGETLGDAQVADSVTVMTYPYCSEGNVWKGHCLQERNPSTRTKRPLL